VQHPLQHGGPSRALGDDVIEALGQPLKGRLAQFLEDLLLVLEIDIETSLREADALGELSRRDGLVSFAEEELLGGAQDLAPPLVALAPGLASLA
jgi:hypothetical protein